MLKTETNKLWMTKDAERKEVERSPLAVKAIAKAPPNLAIYVDDQNLHEVVAHVLQICRMFHAAYMPQWTAMQKKWEKADEYYWMAQKDHRLTELTRAKVSASVFYRVSRRLADGAYVSTFTEELPVKFFPDIGIFEESEAKQKKAVVAEALNRWAIYCMRRTRLKEKIRQSYTNVYKYGNHIVYVPYDYQVEKRKRWDSRDVNIVQRDEKGNIVYKHADTGEISNMPHPVEMKEVEEDVITKDEVGFYPLNIDRIFLDNRIEDLDRQTCLLWRSDVTRAEIFAEARAGKWKNVEKITQLQQFQQYNWENFAELQRIRDAGKITTDSYHSEMYERWQAWILMPKLKVKMNKRGEPTDLEWDQNAEPRRYVLECIGNITGEVVVVRFCESPYWGNGVPFIGAHSHQDDSGWYHRGLQELLEDNMIQEQTAKGQLMDNRTLRNFRPMRRIVGRVKNKDMRITHNTVFDVTSQDAIDFIDVPDITGTIAHTLQYLSNESEAVAQTPPFFLGESMGGRTSATEFAAIRDQSAAPAFNDIKDLNMQLVGGYMRKLKEYAPQFLEHDIAVEVAGPQGGESIVTIKAEEFNADLMLQDVGVQEIENRFTMRQILINLVQVIGQPAFAPFINITGFLMRLFKTFKTVFPNPEEILNKNPEVMNLLRQYLSQKAEAPSPQMLEGNIVPTGTLEMAGIPPPGSPPNVMQIPGLLPEGIAEAEKVAGVAGQMKGT